MNEDANQPLNKKQLFIRNLSYETTKEELEQLFQEVGPLKNISIAAEADGKSKGYGFVKFALEEDAEAALTKLQGHDLHGRKMNLQFGVKKDVKESKKRKSEAQTETERETEREAPVPSQPAQKVAKSEKSESAQRQGEEEDDNAKESGEHVRRSRQILVFGVPVDVNKRVFKAVLQKISRKPVEIELIKQDHKLSGSLHIITPPGKVMLLTAISRQEATKLLNALNEGTINNLGFAKFLGKGKDESDDEEEEDDALHALLVKNRLKERLVARTLADVSELELRKRKCRLIVRNLSFQATAQNVIDKMKRFGPIVEVDVPTTTVEKKARSKGPPTDNAEQETLLKERVKGFAFVTFLCEKDAKSALECADLKVCNRVVAIDLCMSKDTYMKYGKESESEEKQDSEHVDEEKTKDENEGEEDEEVNEEAEDDDDDDGEDKEEEDNDGDEDDEDEEDIADDDSVEETEAAEKPSLTGDVREGRTVFVRGLPFDAVPVDIKRVLGKFGRIEMALIVKDKSTGVSKGCAFVKYAEKSFAELCLTATAEGVTIKDKLCKVDLAVDKDSVEKLKTDAKVGKDKRNLYLANEGLVTDASQVMSEHDREKRLRAQSDKKKKLQNPLFFVSNNRLSIRNLGKNVTDQDLRVACLKATKLGLERGLVTTQDMKNLQLAQGSRWNTAESAAPVTADPLQVPPFDGRHCVKTAKIMVDLDKVRNSIAQSRGYAFVEFHHHAFALACLRQLNNNSMYEQLASSVGGGGGKLMVEFSLENIRKVKILRERTERAKQRNQQATPDESGEKTDKTEKTKRVRKGRKSKRDEKEGSAEPDAKRAKVEKTEKPSPDAKNTSKEEKNPKISNVKLNNKIASKKRVRKPAKKSDKKE